MQVNEAASASFGLGLRSSKFGLQAFSAFSHHIQMSTRSAAKRASAALQANGTSPESIGGSRKLSIATVNQSKKFGRSYDDVSPQVSSGANQSAKRIKTTAVNSEPTNEAELPHGIGKKGPLHTSTVHKAPIKSESQAEAPENTARPKKAKANPYGLTPGKSPFPNHSKPTVQDCEEVHKLLSKVHGLHSPPKVIPPPSATTAGCGEVPDLLNALLRTLLSQATTSSNARVALKGLITAFGKVDESPNWDLIRQSKLEDVVDALRAGGLANAKGKNIKAILDAVYSSNVERRDALIEEKKYGKVAEIPGAKHEDQKQKDMEIAQDKENLLSLDYIFNLSDSEAMNELVKFPGIGVKTASCAMLFCMQRPSFAVDTHVHRHCVWLGWVPESTNENKTFSHLDVRIPNRLKYGLHQLFIKHGKTCFRCRAGTREGSETWAQTVCPIEHLVDRNRRLKGGSSKVQNAVRSEVPRNMVIGDKALNRTVKKGKISKAIPTKRTTRKTKKVDYNAQSGDSETEDSSVYSTDEFSKSDSDNGYL